MKTNSLILCLFFLLFISCQTTSEEKTDQSPAKTANFTTSDYNDLVALFKQWRSFEKPPLLNGAPDYTAATFEKRWPKFKELQQSLNAIDTSDWSVANKVDWMIVWAEMNGYDFNHRILKPWTRDPAFYKTVWTYRSDVPAHEGPTHHALTELWTYAFPLSSEERERLIQDLEVIVPLNKQAKENLTGNARDLWIAGIRDITTQASDLAALKEEVSIQEDTALMRLIDEAIESTKGLASWLTAEAGSKTGPSGIGKENYSWYMQNVHLVPLSWA